MQARKAQHFFNTKQAKTKRAEQQLTHKQEDQEIISLLRNYGVDTAAPLTNETMASFLHTWRKRLPHLRNKIRKIC
jgi:FMN-dependent NADH-azoreductase